MPVYLPCLFKRLSKHLEEYVHDVFQAIAAKRLIMAGFDVYSGQTANTLLLMQTTGIQIAVLGLLGLKPALMFKIFRYAS